MSLIRNYDANLRRMLIPMRRRIGMRLKSHGPPPCALSREKQLAFLREVLKPSMTHLFSGKKGYGKTHLLANLMWLAHKMGYHIITNLIFKQKQEDGTFSKARWPERVHYVTSFLEFMEVVAKVKAQDPSAVFLVVFDEMQVFMSAYSAMKAEPRELVEFIALTRKFDICIFFASPTWNLFPLGIRDWDRAVVDLHFYKDKTHAMDFSQKAGWKYHHKSLVFVECEDREIEVGVLTVGITPWTVPEAKVKPGEFVYDHKVPGTAVKMGHIIGPVIYDKNGDPMMTKEGEIITDDYHFKFEDVVKKMHGATHEEFPERLAMFKKEVDEYRALGSESNAEDTEEERRRAAELEEQQRLEREEEMRRHDEALLRTAEREFIVRLAQVTDLKNKDLAAAGKYLEASTIRSIVSRERNRVGGESRAKNKG